MKKIFLDANVLIDILDNTRPTSSESAKIYEVLVRGVEKYKLFTSCDLLTTVYYFTRKPLGQAMALHKIKKLNQIITVIEFGNKEVDEAIILMERNDKYKDLEDTIQYVMARKEGCDYIITNDKAFASGDVPVLSSEEALKKLT
ncbi:MAG: Ribonuclease [uncultured Sulfurovum sp.]|uniref:Ribonuclease n=1 Tax=uncultured Sulfurovum sp. TaxID=269237 RepID=A0A6S6S8J9_9BACT|nr:MAG: Ribonuclease [uncultured Sulfurovum sp.]